MNITMVVLAAALGVIPTPVPSATPDSCASDGRTGLLATVNRPTVGFSACAVKGGDTVAELGYANQAGSAPLWQLLQGFLRFGSGHGVEADFIGPAYERTRDGSSGFLDSGAGMKWQYVSTQKANAAVDALFTVPSGAASLTTGVPTATLNLDYGTAISSRFGLATTVGGQWSRFFSLLPSAVITDQYSARAQFYVEAFGQTKTRQDGGALSGLDAGFQYLLSPALEFDVEAGRTTTDIARNHYYGFGIVALF